MPFRRPKSARLPPHRWLLWALLVCLPLVGLIAHLPQPQAAGAHWHFSQTRTAVPDAASTCPNLWWQAIRHGQIDRAVRTCHVQHQERQAALRAYAAAAVLKALAAPTTPQARGGAHAHGGLERHHHDFATPGWVPVGEPTGDADGVRSAGATAALNWAAPAAAISVAAPAGAVQRWRTWPAAAFASRTVSPLEHPPRSA